MKNTNMIKQSFDYFLDLSTSDQQASIVKIKAGGNLVKERLLPFFTAFKYYKLGSVSVNMVPASTLPVDPTGLSYEAGETTVDPRDMMNPGLVRITNGEDLCPDDATISEGNYNSLLCDKRWFKFRLQSGFKRSAVPLYWEVGQLHQDSHPGAVRNIPDYLEKTAAITETQVGGSKPDIHVDEGYSDPRGLFQMGQKERVGWMPTDMCEKFQLLSDGPIPSFIEQYGITNIPEIELLTFILPQAHKTKFYYRLYITETVYFKDSVANFIPIDSGYSTTVINTIDRAVHPGYGRHQMTGQGSLSTSAVSGSVNQGQGKFGGEN